MTPPGKICCGYMSTKAGFIMLCLMNLFSNITVIYRKTIVLIYRYTAMEAARGSVDEILRTKTMFFAVYCIDYVVALINMCFEPVLVMAVYKRSRSLLRAYLIAVVIIFVLDVIMIPVLIAIKGIAVPRITGTPVGCVVLLVTYLYIRDGRLVKTATKPAKKSVCVTMA